MPVNKIYKAGITGIAARFFKGPTRERALLQNLCRRMGLNKRDELLPYSSTEFVTDVMKLANQPSDRTRQVFASAEPLHCNVDDNCKLSLCSSQEVRFIIVVR